MTDMPEFDLWTLSGTTDDYEEVQDKLDLRQKALLAGAVNYHALVNPGQSLQIGVYLSADEEYPRLTDVSTITGEWVGQSRPLGSFTIVSSVPGSPRLEPFYDDREGVLRVAGAQRYIRLSPTVANDAKARQAEHLTKTQRIYNRLEKSQTFLLDAIRETRIRRNEKALLRPKTRLSKDWPGPLWEDSDAPDYGPYPLRPTLPGAPRSLLIGMHWLQTGGAERWAFETIDLAKQAGLVPIILTDQLSHHSWITSDVLNGCLVLPLTLPLQGWRGDEPLLRALAENFELSGVLIHHCAWLYSRLPWFHRYLPDIPIADSLHIIEYKGGGYPGYGATYDDLIDTHHVISPQLFEWFTEVQQVDPDHVVMAPLSGLTTSASGDFQGRVEPDVFTVAFVGRLARQKRPDVFLAAAEELHRQMPDVRFIMHGSGELEPLVERQLEERGLAGVVERRDEGTPVSDTYADADLLLLTSANEGLALTVFEAVAAGIPVASTDVGSQKTVVPPEALLPRSARGMVRHLSPLIRRLKDDEGARRMLWQQERQAADNLAAVDNASQWVQEWMKGLTQ